MKSRQRLGIFQGVIEEVSGFFRPYWQRLEIFQGISEGLRAVSRSANL